MNYKDFQCNLVQVNSGTGVLVPALSEEYCFVFTAKHNLATQTTVRSHSGDINIVIAEEDCYASETSDAAIIVLRGTVAPHLAISKDLTTHGLNITLAGYPALRSESHQPERFLDGQVKHVLEDSFQIFCEEFPVQGDILGISGGGVFFKSSDEWVLVGIEFGIVGEEGENCTQLNCCTVGVFEAIIQKHGLAAPYPPFFDNFQKLCDFSFPLPGTFFDESKRGILTKILQSYTRAQVTSANITPQSLHIELDASLFVKGTPPHCVNHRKLWISWLELLALSLLVDEKKAEELDMDYISELHRKRRLLYSNSTEDWGKFIRDIVATTMDGLDKEAIVFVSNNCASPPHKFEIDPKRLPVDISRVTSSFFDFTASGQQPKPSRFVHIDGLHVQCVNHQEDRYECINAQDTIKQIKDEYASFIKR